MSALRSFRSELIKLRTVRSTWLLALVMLLYVGVSAGGFAAIAGAASDQQNSPFAAGGIDVAPLVYSLATSVGYVFLVLVGALAVTTEFRFQTLTPTLLATPRRASVLVGKLAAGVVVGIVFALVGLVATVGIGGGLLAVFGIDTELGDGDTWALLGRIVLAMVLWSLIGVGLGTLLPNQVVVIVVVLAFTQFIEPILRVASAFADWTAEIGRFLPGAAGDALVGSSLFTSISGGAADPLEQWQGGLVLLGIAAVLTIAGSLTTWRRDVT
ncbi:ABC transporter permease [Schumannella sp. 10F1B-5-1]|uniref:ABC transporter permease n=1 Tax=Schumannella sp. 10F1B-5-1 TaxID=2590780 RepID=UPI0011312C71|nr:ABC transporter permease [Schumannella sp. 10F1B-5-1]TPW70649.1 ABC transporter permease subunit [Schumannella sp. 10F1B-5-1]